MAADPEPGSKTMVSLRLDDDLIAWADAYAKERGVSRSELLVQATISFKEDCDRGVPEFRERVKRQSYAGKVSCQGERSAVHPWVTKNGVRVCSVCGKVKPSREDFARATADRTGLFSQLEAPASVKRWGKAAGEDQSK